MLRLNEIRLEFVGMKLLKSIAIVKIKTEGVKPVNHSWPKLSATCDNVFKKRFFDSFNSN